MLPVGAGVYLCRRRTYGGHSFGLLRRGGEHLLSSQAKSVLNVLSGGCQHCHSSRCAVRRGAALHCLSFSPLLYLRARLPHAGNMRLAGGMAPPSGWRALRVRWADGTARMPAARQTCWDDDLSGTLAARACGGADSGLLLAYLRGRRRATPPAAHLRCPSTIPYCALYRRQTCGRRTQACGTDAAALRFGLPLPSKRYLSPSLFTSAVVWLAGPPPKGLRTTLPGLSTGIHSSSMQTYLCLRKRWRNHARTPPHRRVPSFSPRCCRGQRRTPHRCRVARFPRKSSGATARRAAAVRACGTARRQEATHRQTW